MIRCSNLDRRAACPGSERMEEGLPDAPSAESREGVELHHFQAHPELDRQFLQPHLQELLKTADELDAQVFDAVIQNEKLLDSDEWEQMREVAVNRDNLPGHIDLLRRYPKRAVTVIRDSKFGYVPVERAELNMQLRGYASMSDDETVYVAITQPRAPFSQRITLAKYTHKDVEAARDQIEGIIAAAKAKDAALAAGDWCRYCKARAICPELAKAVRSGLVPLEDIPPELELSKAARLERVEARLAEVSDADLSKMLSSYALIQFVHEPMMDEARRRIGDGKLDGWRLSKATERRKITDSQRAISLLALAGMSREDIMACATLSLSKLETKLDHGELRTGQTIKGAKDAKAFTNRVLQSVIEVEVTSPRVLREK